MANLKSSKKDIRRSAKRAEANRHITSKLKTLLKNVREAEKAEDNAVTAKAAITYISALERASSTGVVHKNKVNRHKAGLAKYIYQTEAKAS